MFASIQMLFPSGTARVRVGCLFLNDCHQPAETDSFPLLLHHLSHQGQNLVPAFTIPYRGTSTQKGHLIIQQSTGQVQKSCAYLESGKITNANNATT